jgi:hypothetical protein
VPFVNAAGAAIALSFRKDLKMQKNAHAQAHSYAGHSRRGFHFVTNVLLVLAGLAFNTAQAQTTNYALGTPALLGWPGSGNQ